MDAQDFVLASHPDADAIEEPPILRHGDLSPVDHGYWAILNESDGAPLGGGATEEAAWEDAARKLRAAARMQRLRSLFYHASHPRFEKALHFPH